MAYDDPNTRSPILAARVSSSILFAPSFMIFVPNLIGLCSGRVKFQVAPYYHHLTASRPPVIRRGTLSPCMVSVVTGNTRADTPPPPGWLRRPLHAAQILIRPIPETIPVNVNLASRVCPGNSMPFT